MKHCIMACCLLICVSAYSSGTKAEIGPASEPKTLQLLPDRYDLLPAGAIKARGWTAQMLSEDSQGWVRTVMDICRNPANTATDLFPYPSFHSPLVRKDKRANSRRTAGGCLQAYWLYSIFNYGWIGGLDEYKKLGNSCMNDILSACDRDGYIGYYDTAQGNIARDGYAMNGLGEILMACLCYYELTGDERVLEACRKSADHYIAFPFNIDGQGWSVTLNQFYARLYIHTKNASHLKYAERLHFVTKKASTTLSDPWARGQEHQLNRKHSAGTALYLAAMLDLYRASGQQRWLDGILNVNTAVLQHFVDATGAPCAASELLNADIDVSQPQHELCGSCLWMLFWARMTGVTGKALYGDYSEKVFFNQMQAGRDKDGKAHCYFTSPNWHGNRSAGNDNLVGIKVANAGSKAWYCYDTVWECCSGNSARALLNWLANAAFISVARKEIAIQAYAPYSLSAALGGAGVVAITLDTDYPFREAVRIHLDSVENQGVFALLLRKPGWCRKPVLAVNGSHVAAETDSNGFIRIEREWKTGDTIDLALTMEPRIAGKASRIGLVALEYGPFLLSRPIPGNRLEMMPNIYKKKSGKEFFWEFAGGRKDTAINDTSTGRLFYSVDRDKPSTSLKRVDKHDIDENKHVWESSPFEFEIRAHGERSPEEIVIKLVPIGFTRLRETYLPLSD